MMNEPEPEFQRDKNRAVKTAESARGSSAGTRLKKAREAKGLTLEIVHDATKIPMDALRAIEEGYNVRTLSPFYYKGFLKIYAQYLDLDISEEATAAGNEPDGGPALAEEGRQFFFRDLAAKVFSARRIQQFLSVFFVLFVFFLIFKVITFVFNRPKKEGPVRTVILPEPVAADRPKPAEEPAPRPRVVVPPPKVDPPPPSRPPTETRLAPVPVVVPAPRAEPLPSGAPQVTKKVTLVVRARTDSWLSVKADGQVVFQFTLPRGSVKTWLADESIEISGRNLDQLELELNGKMIGPLGRRQRGAKTILIKEDGLTVTR
jgi:cytoskeletal protein RodZ